MKALFSLAIAGALLVTACASGATGQERDPVTSETTTMEPPTTDPNTDSTTTTPTSASAPAPPTVPEPTVAAPDPSPLAGLTIVLDPGHNGRNWEHPDEIGALVDIGTGTKACNTTGTETLDGYPEATFTWEVAKATRSTLEEMGAEVILTRQDNDGWGPCITERAAMGNRAGADAVISIHADGGPSDGRGFHVIRPLEIPGLTDDIAGDSERLAVAIHDAYLVTGMPIADYIGEDGYSVRDDLGGLMLSDVPVVFLECGNMRNEADAALLSASEFRQAIAAAVADGLGRFLAG